MNSCANSSHTGSREVGGARWSYRNGLDGLRCIAVLLVIGFHAGIPWLANGYVGVDVFFVLSGYLVTTVILQAGPEHFGFAAFYARRVRRLLPAAVTAVIITSLATLLYLPSLTRAALVDDARAALLYVANWRFISQSTDYFADDLDSSPFLHYWSLAIEEQFYLVYPLVLIGTYRLARRRMGTPGDRLRVAVAVVVALAGVSTALQLVWASRDPTHAYFGTDARLYQMLLGAAAAGMIHLRRDGGLRTIARLTRPLAPLALAGVALLAGTAVAMSVSSRGIVVAVVATVLVVALDTNPHSSTNSGLALRVPRVLGRTSYAIYLVHWPLILVLRDLFVLDPVVLALITALASAGLAALSYELLEHPIRTDVRLGRLPRVVIAAGLATSVVAALVVAPWILRSDVKPSVRANEAIVVELEPSPDTTAAARTDGPAAVPDGEAAGPDAQPPQTEAGVATLLAAPVPEGLDFATALVGVPGFECPPDDIDACVVKRGGDLGIHLIGDSNASMFRPMFEALAVDHGFTYSESTLQGCPFQLGLATTSVSERCAELRAGWYRRLGNDRAPDVIVAVNLDYEFEPLPNRASWTAAETESDPPEDVDAAIALFRQRTVEAIDALSARGATVVLVEPLPYDQNLDPTACLSGASTIGQCAFARPVPSPTVRIYREIAAERVDVVSLDLGSFACPFDPICLPLLDGRPVFRDPTHLSIGYTVPERTTFWDLLVASGALP